MADLVVANATVVTMDAAGTVHDQADVVVEGDRIAAVGPAAGRLAHGARVIDARGGIVLPGLINAHTHLAMTMFRGLADDLDLDGFLGRLQPAESTMLSDDTVAAGTALAVAECLRAGITTALDMYFFPEAARAVAAETGFQLLTGPVFVEFPGPDRRPFDERVTWAEQWLAATPASRRYLCPHSTYLLSAGQLRTVADLADRYGAGLHVHACETTAELDRVRQRDPGTPIEVLHDTGLLGPRTALAPGVHVSAADIELIAESGAAVAHCPRFQPQAGERVRADLRLSGRGRECCSRHGRCRFVQRPRPVPGHAPRRLPASRAARRRAGADGAGDGDDPRRPCGRARRRHRFDRDRQARRPRGPRRSLAGDDAGLRPDLDHHLRRVAGRRAHGHRRGLLAVEDRVMRTVDVDAAISAVHDPAPRVLAAAGHT